MDKNTSPEQKNSKNERQLSGVKRKLLIFAGTLSLGLSVIGIVLPIIPTTPFLLLSAACYYKSSERMHKWLINHKLFGKYIKNYMEGKRPVRILTT